MAKHAGALPMTQRRVERVDVTPFLPRLPSGDRATGLLMEIDFAAVDGYLADDSITDAGLPDWVLASSPRSLPHLRRFALESGLCRPGPGPTGVAWGAHGPGVRLRQVDAVVTLLPASGRIVIFDGTPEAQKWIAALGAPAAPRTPLP